MWVCKLLRGNMSGYSYVMNGSRSSLLGGWFRGTQRREPLGDEYPTIDVCDKRVSMIDNLYRWLGSEVEFSSLMFATNGGFVRFDNVVNRMETFERETTYE